MRTNLLDLSEKKFEELCQALLMEECPHFEAFSPPDSGMDGYDRDTQTIFQVYFPEREPRKDKILSDIEKAKRHGWPCKRWILLIPKNPTPALRLWLEEQQPSAPFAIEAWGATRIRAFLLKHAKVREAYFPTELRKEIRRLAKGKGPKQGDAGPGEEVSAENATELKRLVEQIINEEAERKRRKPQGGDFAREWGEFDAHFHLSSYDRLPAAKFLEARRYLETKLFARRRSDRRDQERKRLVAGIHAIQKKLRMTNGIYRQTLREAVGKDSTADMDIEELRRVFKKLRYLQGLNEAESIS